MAKDKLKDINWKESVGKRFVTRVTRTAPVNGDIVVYMREIKVRDSVNDGEQVKISFPNNNHEAEWVDTLGKTLRLALANGGVQTYDVIGEVTSDEIPEVTPGMRIKMGML